MSDETPRLRLPQLVSQQEMTNVTWNEALAQLDVLVDLAVLDQSINNPPATPRDGDAYLIGGAPSGAWAGYAYKIAACLDGAWRFYTPFNGLRAYVVSTGALLVYLNGIWTDWNALISANEVSIASAATCDLGVAGALFVQITGNTAITSFGSAANRLRFVRFAQSLTLTHSAAALVLLGGANRVTAAGDVGIYASDGAGKWCERSYFRAAVDPGALRNKLHTQVAGPSSSGTGMFTMQGIGVQFTPKMPGPVKFQVWGWIRNAALGGESDAQLAFGTGAPPVNGAAACGTVISGAAAFVAGVANQVVPFSLYGETDTPLVAGTPYWFDIQLRGITGAASVGSLDVLVEQVAESV